MGDAGQHVGPLGHEARDAALHGVEGVGGLAHLARALGLDGAGVAAEAEILRRLGQPANRAHLVLHEQHRDEREQDGGAHHPQHEDDEGGREQALARRLHAQDALRELDADDDGGGVGRPVRVEGERRALAQRLLEVALERQQRAPGRAGGGRVHARAGLEAEREAEAPVALAQDERAAILARRLDQVGDEGDVAGEARGEAAGDDIEVAAIEQLERDGLERHERQQHDEHGAAEQPAGKDAAREAGGLFVGAAARGAARDPAGAGCGGAAHRGPV